MFTLKCSKRKVLISVLKLSKEEQCRIKFGSEFHSFGAAKRKVRSPLVFSFAEGTCSSLFEDALNRLEGAYLHSISPM